MRRTVFSYQERPNRCILICFEYACAEGTLECGGLTAPSHRVDGTLSWAAPSWRQCSKAASSRRTPRCCAHKSPEKDLDGVTNG
jgi:hypothetical protein